MNTEYIKIEVISRCYRVDLEWLEELNENGLVRIHEINPDRFIHTEELSLLERMINLHQDLGVNIAGIEVILNLLERIEHYEERL